MKKFLAIDAVLVILFAVSIAFYFGQTWQKKQAPQTLSFLLTQPVFKVTGTVKNINDKELTLETTFNILPPPPTDSADEVEEVKKLVKTITFAIDSSTTITQNEPPLAPLRPPANAGAIVTAEKTKTISDIKDGMTVTVYSTKDVRQADIGSSVIASNITLPDVKNRMYMRIVKVNTNGTYLAEPAEDNGILAKSYTINTNSATEYSQIEPQQGGVVVKSKSDIAEGKVYIVHTKEDANTTQSLTARRIEMFPAIPAPQASANTLN